MARIDGPPPRVIKGPRGPSLNGRSNVTEYVILTKNEGGDGEIATYKNVAINVGASSAEAAVRKHAQTAGAGTYVAIPARQFKPLTVHVETVQRVKVGGATG